MILCPLTCTQHPFTIEYRREPFGNRLRIDKNPQQRDITKWSKYETIPPMLIHNILDSIISNLATNSPYIMLIRLEPTPLGFFAYHHPMHGTTPFMLDWSSAPDRYMISTQVLSRHLLKSHPLMSTNSWNTQAWAGCDVFD